MNRSVLCLLLCSFCVCRKPPSPPPPPESPPPDLPPLPELSVAFRGDLDREPTSPAEPAESASCRWNFAPGAKYFYAIDQTIVNDSQTKDRFGNSRIRTTARGEGRLELDGSPSRVARALYKMTLRESVVDGVPMTPEQLNRQPAAKVECAFREDGSIEQSKTLSGGDAQALEFLFALPGRELRSGETFERPYRTYGTYRQTGTLSTKLTGFARVDRYRCARLETEFAMTLAPAATDGSGTGKMRGHGVAYLAIPEGCFVRIDAAVSFAYATRQKSTKPDRGDLWNVGTTESHTLIRARLQ